MAASCRANCFRLISPQGETGFTREELVSSGQRSVSFEGSSPPAARLARYERPGLVSMEAGPAPPECGIGRQPGRYEPKRPVLLRISNARAQCSPFAPDRSPRGHANALWYFRAGESAVGVVTITIGVNTIVAAEFP